MALPLPTQSGKTIQTICFFAVGLIQLAVLPQLFCAIFDIRLVILVGQILDDLLIIGEVTRVEYFLTSFNSKFSLDSVAHGPRNQSSYGMNII